MTPTTRPKARSTNDYDRETKEVFFGLAKKISPKAIREVKILSGPINEIVPLICHVSPNAMQQYIVIR